MLPTCLRGAGFADKPKEYSFAHGNHLNWDHRGCGGVRVEHGGDVEGVVTWFTRHLDRDWVIAFACSYQPRTDRGEIAERLARVVEKGE